MRAAVRHHPAVRLPPIRYRSTAAQPPKGPPADGKSTVGGWKGFLRKLNPINAFRETKAVVQELNNFGVKEYTGLLRKQYIVSGLSAVWGSFLSPALLLRTRLRSLRGLLPQKRYEMERVRKAIRSFAQLPAERLVGQTF